MVRDREVWRAAVVGSQRVRHNWVTEQQQSCSKRTDSNMLKRKSSVALFGVHQGVRVLRVRQQCRVWLGTAKGNSRAAFGPGACRKGESLEEAS